MTEMLFTATERYRFGYVDQRTVWNGIGGPTIISPLYEIAWRCRGIPYCANGWQGPSCSINERPQE